MDRNIEYKYEQNLIQPKDKEKILASLNFKTLP